MFNIRLKDLRLEKDLTQKELAKQLGCNQSMITRWEKGECEPTETMIRRAAIYFGVSSDYLIGLEDIDGHKGDNTYTMEYTHEKTNLKYKGN